MPQTVKNYRRQSCGIGQLAEQKGNLPFLVGTSVLMGNDKIKVLIAAGQQFLYLLLSLFLFRQCQRYGFRQKHLSHTALRFRGFQHQRGSGTGLLPLGECQQDGGASTPFQCRKAILLAAFQFLCDPHMDCSGTDGILRNVHAVPCQAQYFPDTHRTAECQQHTQLQYGIGAGVQSPLCFTGRPHGAFLRLIFGQRHAQGGIGGDIFPDDRLIQRTAQQSVRLFNH